MDGHPKFPHSVEIFVSTFVVNFVSDLLGLGDKMKDKVRDKVYEKGGAIGHLRRGQRPRIGAPVFDPARSNIVAQHTGSENGAPAPPSRALQFRCHSSTDGV